MERKGQVWISATIYTLVIITALVIILAATQPLIDRMRDKAAVQKQKETMTALDNQISGIAAEGPGSQRVIPIDIMDGQIVVANDGLVYNVETDSKVVEPRSQVELGNLKLSSGTDVNAYEDGDFVLENSKIRVTFINTDYLNDTEEIIKELLLLSTNGTVTDVFTFDIGDGSSLEEGSYTLLEQEGTSLGTASVKAFCNQTNFEYDLVFTLDSEADFIRADIENLVRK